MAIDPNEAPEGTIAVEYKPGEDACKKCKYLHQSGRCWDRNDCNAANRKDNTNVYFIEKPKPTEKTMEDEYEYITANTREEWKQVVDAIFCGDCEIKRTIAKYDINEKSGVSFTVVWDKADRVEVGRHYRRKKP